MAGTGGPPGREGPEGSPFGPLELPRDETELLDYDDWADAAPPPPPQPQHPQHPQHPQQPPYPSPPAAGGDGRTMMFPPSPAPPPTAPGVAGPQGTGPVAYPQGLFRADAGAAGRAPAHYGLPQAPIPTAGPRSPAPPHERPGLSVGVMAAVAGGAIAVALVVVAFASGVFGDDEPASAAAAPATSATAPATAGPESPSPAEKTPRTTAPATTPASGGAARQLDALFKIAAGSRTTVSQAVNQIQRCDNLAGAVADLRAAAGQRDRQLAQLGNIDADQLDDGDDLVRKLREAWTQSAAADRKLAAWGEEMARGGCERGRARTTDTKRDADRASARATRAKTEAVRLWNPIATSEGLPTRTALDI